MSIMGWSIFAVVSLTVIAGVILAPARWLDDTPTAFMDKHWYHLMVGFMALAAFSQIMACFAHCQR